MDSAESYRDDVIAITEEYRSGQASELAASVLLRCDRYLAGLEHALVADLCGSLESLQAADIGDVETRLYLLASARLGTAKHELIELALDRLMTASNNDDHVATVRLTACLVEFTVSVPGDSPLSADLMARVISLALQALALSPLVDAQKSALLNDYFQRLGAWGLVPAGGALLSGLERSESHYLPPSVLYHAHVVPRLAPDDALSFMLGGYLSALIRWESPMIFDIPVATLIDAAYSGSIAAIEDGSGDEALVLSAARAIVSFLRTLPLRSRLDLTRELLRVVRLRPTHSEASWLVGLQYANWLSALSGSAAENELDLLDRLVPDDGLAVHTIWRSQFDVLRSKIAFRQGDLTAAEELANRAASTSPDDLRVRAQVRGILKTIHPLDYDLADDEVELLSHGDAVGLFYLEARSRLERKDAAGAIEQCDRGLAYPLPATSSSLSFTNRRLRLLRAAALLMLGDYPEALREILRAADDLVSLICSSSAGLNDVSYRNWFSESEHILDRAIQVVVACLQRGEAVAATEACTLWRLISALRDVELVFHETVRDQWRQGTSLGNQYKASHDLLRDCEFATLRSVGGQGEGFREAFTRVVTLSKSMEAVMSGLPEAQRRLARRLALDIKDVEDALGSDEFLIEFASYWTGLVSDDGAGIRALVGFGVEPRGESVAIFTTSPWHLTEEALIEVVADLDIAANDTLDAPIDPEVLARTMRTLARSVGATRLLVIPDGPLSDTALSAIPLDGGFLDDWVEVELVGNSADLLCLPPDGSPSDPIFVALTAEEMAPSPSDSLDAIAFARLSGPDVEVTRLARLHDVEPLTGASASYSYLAELASPRMLHVAGHGYYLESLLGVGVDLWADLNAEPTVLLSLPRLHLLRGSTLPLLSGLALPSVNSWLRSEEEEPGVFTAYDLSWVDLSATEVVVLAGCSTGAGPVERWRGLVDLRRAAMTAGARNVIVSLQPISDIATTFLMLLMYEHSVGSGGLRAAQRLLREATVKDVEGWLAKWEIKVPDFGGLFLSEVLRQPSDWRPFAAPKYWSSIVCYTTRTRSGKDKG
ncbi:MAG: CHAT domain-containing protein [Candidatus Nanopelagicales bacterium]